MQGRLFTLISTADCDQIFAWCMEITDDDGSVAVVYRRDPGTGQTMHAVHESAESALARYSRVVPMVLVRMDFRDEFAAQLDDLPR